VLYRLATPGVGDEVVEIRVLQWHGDVGAAFAAGELIVELETHKALIEVRAGQAGILRRIFAADGAWIQVGQSFAVFSDAPDEPVGDDPAAEAAFLANFVVD
jgi:pyruvate/2-oxoglutarate dehydrogenase complex dihydrolipoamide acyltransferase (E2) component